jgi:uncharacterized protein involved in exopolysaccharide biosynthesis
MSTVDDRPMPGGELEMRVIFARLWAGRRWIALSTVVSVVAFAVAAFVITPVYRAVTVAVPTSAEANGLSGLSSALGSLGGLAALGGINLGNSNNVEESLAVLRSREFSEAFIRDMGLMQELYRNKWDAKAGRWEGDEKDWPSLADGYRRFDRKVRTASYDKKTELVTVGIVWRDPVKAAALANELVARLNREMRERAITRTSDAVKFLQKELEDKIGRAPGRERVSKQLESEVVGEECPNKDTERQAAQCQKNY